MTKMDVLTLTYGIIFQEYNYKEHYANKKNISTQFRFLWITVTTFITMAFIGNLKSTLVRQEFMPRTQTLNEMVDKDMPIHVPNVKSMYMENLEKNHLNSSINKRILCQAYKTDGIYQVE